MIKNRRMPQRTTIILLTLCCAFGVANILTAAPRPSSQPNRTDHDDDDRRQQQEQRERESREQAERERESREREERAREAREAAQERQRQESAEREERAREESARQDREKAARERESREREERAREQSDRERSAREADERQRQQEQNEREQIQRQTDELPRQQNVQETPPHAITPRPSPSTQPRNNSQDRSPSPESPTRSSVQPVPDRTNAPNVDWNGSHDRSSSSGSNPVRLTPPQSLNDQPAEHSPRNTSSVRTSLMEPHATVELSPGVAMPKGRVIEQFDPPAHSIPSPAPLIVHSQTVQIAKTVSVNGAQADYAGAVRVTVRRGPNHGNQGQHQTVHVHHEHQNIHVYHQHTGPHHHHGHHCGHYWGWHHDHWDNWHHDHGYWWCPHQHVYIDWGYPPSYEANVITYSNGVSGPEYNASDVKKICFHEMNNDFIDWGPDLVKIDGQFYFRHRMRFPDGNTNVHYDPFNMSGKVYDPWPDYAVDYWVQGWHDCRYRAESSWIDAFRPLNPVSDYLSPTDPWWKTQDNLYAECRIP